MKYFKFLSCFLMLMVLSIALVMVAYALFMKYSSTGADCYNLSYEKIESAIKDFHNDFPGVFTMSGFHMQGDFEYIEGRSGDLILQNFETDSGYYRARITCDRGVDIEPWHNER